MLTLLATLSLALPLTLAQDSPAIVDDAVDLTVRISNEPLLIEGKQSIKLSVGDGKYDFKGKFAFVDQHELLDDTVEKAFRHFVYVHNEVGGRITDPPLSGLRANYVVTDETSFEAPNGEGFVQETIDEIVGYGNSLGLWCDLPAGVTVGTEFDADLLRIGSVLFGEPYPDRVDARMTFVSYDESKSLATLTGTLEAEQGDHNGDVVYRAKCVMTVDTEQGRIVSIKIDGKGELSDPGGGAVATAKIDLEVKTRRGAPALKALKSKPKYRMREFDIEPFGLVIELPSVWTEANTDDGDIYELSRTNLGGAAVISLEGIDYSSKDPKDYYPHFERSHTETFGSSPAESTSINSKLGKGRRFVWNMEDEDGPFVIVKDLLPLDGQWLLIHLNVPTDSYKSVRKELDRARKSLRIMK